MSKHDARMTTVERSHGKKRKRIVVVHTWKEGAIPKGYKIVPQYVHPPISEHDEVYRVVHTFWSPLSGPPLARIAGAAVDDENEDLKSLIVATPRSGKRP